MGPGTSCHNELNVFQIALCLQLTGSERFANAQSWPNELAAFGACLWVLFVTDM